MKQGIDYIKSSQFISYLNGEDDIFQIKIPINFEGGIKFKDGLVYRLSLPRKLKKAHFDFGKSIVSLAGRKNDEIKVLNDICLDCQTCILDLSAGMNGVPTNINAANIIVIGADYIDKTSGYPMLRQSKINKATIEGILKNSGSIYFKDSILNMGINNFDIDCKNFSLDNSEIILPYNVGNVNCDNLVLTDSSLVTYRQGLSLNASNATLSNSVIKSEEKADCNIDNINIDKTSVFEIDEKQRVKTKAL